MHMFSIPGPEHCIAYFQIDVAIDRGGRSGFCLAGAGSGSTASSRVSAARGSQRSTDSSQAEDRVERATTVLSSNAP